MGPICSLVHQGSTGSAFFLLMNAILNLGQISPSLLRGANGHQAAQGSCGPVRGTCRENQRRRALMQWRATAASGGSAGSSESREVRGCRTAASRSMPPGKGVGAELGPTTRPTSSCTRASENLQLPRSRPAAAHPLPLLHSIKGKTVTGE